MRTPRRSEIVQATGNFHNRIIETLGSITEHIFDNPTAFDAGDHMFDTMRTLEISVLRTCSSAGSSLPQGFFSGCRMMMPSGA